MNAVSARATRRPGEYGLTRTMLAINIAIGFAAIVIALALALIVRGSTEATTAESSTLAAISASAKADALAHRVLADVLEIGINRRARKPSFSTHADLNDAATELDATLRKISDGRLDAANETTLAGMRADWAPIRRDLSIMGDYPSSPQALDAVIERTLGVSSHLVAGLDSVRASLETASAERAREADRERTFAMVAIAVSAFLIAILVVIRLRAANGETQRFAGMLERMVADLAKTALRVNDTRVNDELLKASGTQGMLSIDHRLHVVAPFSSELGEIFDVPDLEGRALAPLLQRVAARKDHHEIDLLVKDLFDASVPDDRLAIHLLRAVEVGTTNADGTSFIRTLRFGFRRVREDNEIATVLVAVADVSDRVALERELTESERRRVRQQAFLEFATTAERTVVEGVTRDLIDFSRQLGETMRADGFATALKGRAETVHAAVEALQIATHKLRTRIAAADFTYFVKILDSFDSDALEVMLAARVIGDEYLSFAIASAELASELESYRSFTGRFAGALVR